MYIQRAADLTHTWLFKNCWWGISYKNHWLSTVWKWNRNILSLPQLLLQFQNWPNKHSNELIPQNPLNYNYSSKICPEVQWQQQWYEGNQLVFKACCKRKFMPSTMWLWTHGCRAHRPQWWIYYYYLPKQTQYCLSPEFFFLSID